MRAVIDVDLLSHYTSMGNSTGKICCWIICWMKLVSHFNVPNQCMQADQICIIIMASYKFQLGTLYSVWGPCMNPLWGLEAPLVRCLGSPNMGLGDSLVWDHYRIPNMELEAPSQCGAWRLQSVEFKSARTMFYLKSKMFFSPFLLCVQ